MARMLSTSRVPVLAVWLTMAAAPFLAAQQDSKQQGAPASVSSKAIAEQLGVRLQPRDDDELHVGASFTAVLEAPEKLAAFGVKGMHPGARVTVARVAPNKIRIEADEMSPAPANAFTTLELNAKGALVAKQ